MSYFVLLFVFFNVFVVQNSALNEEDKLDVIEKLFNVTNDDEKSKEFSLKQLEDDLRETVQSGLKQLMPYFFQSGSGSNASPMCMFDLFTMFIGFRHLDSWVYKMLDSNGKIPTGILEGTATSLGDYDECLNTVIGGKSANKLSSKGQYCLLEINLPKPIIQVIKDFQTNKESSNYTLSKTKTFLQMFQNVKTNPDLLVYRMGVCMPSSCDEWDIESFVDMAPKNLAELIEVKHCEVKEDLKLDKTQIVIITFLSLIVTIVCFSTIIDFFSEQSKAEIQDRSLTNGKKSIRARLFTYLYALSIQRSIKNLMDCSSEGDVLNATRGMKVLTIIFMILGHTYGLPDTINVTRFRDPLNFLNFVESLPFAIIANPSVGADTFFVLAGFFSIYYRWRLSTKPRILFYIGKFILLNYLRMVLVQLLVIALFFLFPLVGNGPMWQEFVGEPLQRCRETWWMNILFAQNFLKANESCIYQSWILATIMQLFVLTAPLIWLMHRWPIIGIFTNLSIILIGSVAVGIVTISNEFPATLCAYFYDYRTADRLFQVLYSQTYSHIGPYCIGMLLAYYITDVPKKGMKTAKVYFLWILSLSLMNALIFGLYDYRNGKKMERSLAVFYAVVHRPAWAIAIALIIYACTSEAPCLPKTILMWKVFAPLERLCYLAYLLHVPLIYFQGGFQRELIFMNHYTQVMSFFSNAVTSFGISFFCYLLFQGPWEVIEKKVFNCKNGNIWSIDESGASQNATRGSVASSSVELNSLTLFNRCHENNAFQLN